MPKIVFSQRQITAYHEAAHIVFAHLLGIRIKSARVRGRNGTVRYAPAAEQTATAADDRFLGLLVAVSGIAAEARLQGVPVGMYFFKNKKARDAAVHDCEVAHLHLMALLDHCDYRTRQLLVLEAMIAAEDACKSVWVVVQRIAGELLRRKRVPGSRLHTLAEAATTIFQPQDWLRLETLMERATKPAPAHGGRGVPMPSLQRLGF